MTTIAYNHRDREMATDSQATAGYCTVSTTTTKLFRVVDGWLAFCGNWADAQCLMDYLAGDEVDLKGLEVGAFIMPDTGNPYQLVLSNAGRVQQMPISCSFALGSGSDYALGAMEAGASAKDAVKAAIKYDVFSGGRVVVKKRGVKK